MKAIWLFLCILPGLQLSAQQDPYLIKTFRNSNPVNAIAYSPDGTKILAGFSDGSASVTDLESGKTEVSVKDHWKGVLAVKYDPKSRYFITAGDNRILVWSNEGKLIYPLKKHTTTIFSADIEPTGEFLISGSVSPAFKLWNVLQGEFIKDFMGHSAMTMAVKYSRDGKWMGSASSDHTVKIWDASSGEEIMSLPSHADDIYAIDFSPNGKMLASCSKDKTIRIYDLEKKELFTILTGHKNFVMDVEFAPDNLHLVSCSFDKEIRLWEIPTGKNLYSFIDHEGEITDICFSPDGKSFASASQDKTFRIWDYNTDIFVDFYYSDEIISEMEDSPLFQPKQKGEAKNDYEARMEKAALLKDEIYARYYKSYLEELGRNSWPGK